jgi:hypothetical protein
MKIAVPIASGIASVRAISVTMRLPVKSGSMP